MNTYTINQDKIKICLSDDEVKSLFGSYEMIDYNSPHSRAVLDSLLCSALPESMLPLDCKKVLIEVIEEQSGCSIQITRIYDKGKRLRKVSGRHKYILLFKSSEEMMAFVSQTDIDRLRVYKNSKLMKVGKNFALSFSCEKGISDYTAAHINEYGILLDSSLPVSAAILEHGEIICCNALEKMIHSFKK